MRILSVSVFYRAICIQVLGVERIRSFGLELNRFFSRNFTGHGFVVLHCLQYSSCLPSSVGQACFLQHVGISHLYHRPDQRGHRWNGLYFLPILQSATERPYATLSRKPGKTINTRYCSSPCHSAPSIWDFVDLGICQCLHSWMACRCVDWSFLCVEECERVHGSVFHFIK